MTHLSSMSVYNVADLSDGVFKHAAGGGVGDHH